MTKTGTILRCGTLLTMKDGKAEPISDAMLAIEGAKIAAIGPWDATAALGAAKVIDCSTKIVMPGLVNGHCHLPMSMFRGLADDLSFDEWLHKYILPLERRLVSPDFVKLGSELSLLELIRGGVTTVFDMYFFEADIAKVVTKSGLRAVLGESIMDFPTPDNPHRDEAEYRMLEAMIEQYRGHERINIIAAPHAPYSCSDATLKKAVAFCERHNIGLGIHVSETTGEVAGSLKEHGLSPVARMKKLGVTGQNSIFAHCVHLTDEDVAILAESGTSAIHNPESNMKLGVGVSPLRRLLKAGVCVGLGTDGPASNNDLSLFGEMDAAAKLQKVHHSDPTAMTALDVLRMATCEGARAMKLGKICGTLEVGKMADLVVVNPNVPHFQPIHNLASQLVYAAKDSDVESVMVHGKFVMENHKVLTLDQEEILDRVKHFRVKHQF